MYLFNLTIEYRVIIGISAMIVLFTGFLISFITSQRKKLQYHKELQRLNDLQQQSLLEQNSLLEQRVEERTTELNLQKDALQASLTELKVTQMHLIQREKMASLGELTAGIAHEIQNPLNFVNNFSGLSTELLDELKEEINANNTTSYLAIVDDLAQNLQKISQHGNRASNIVSGMLEHSRSSTGKRQLTDINALIDEYLRLAYQGFKTRNKSFSCDLVLELSPKLTEVDIVPQDLGRVLVNIYSNAFYSLREKQKQAPASYQPTVTIRTRQTRKGTAIQIIDNGLGIPEPLRAKIFQPFFTTKPTGQGIGLGLSLSYDIVTKEHNGELSIESQAGEGAEFSIILP